MEIMNSNLSNPLKMSRPTAKRGSYIKPPIPPKPKIIPKPKDLDKLKLLNTKLLQLNKINAKLKENCEFNSDLSIKEESNVNIVRNELETKTDVKLVNNLSSQNVYTVSDYSNTSMRESCIKICVNNVSVNSVDNTVDVSSCLMEKALEDCVELGLSSKSSSTGSSISLGDSDSDEYLHTESRPVSVSLAAVTLYDTGSDSSNTPIVLHDSAGTDFSNSGKEVSKESHKARKAFLVAKEIQTSEESFVAVLKLLNEELHSFFIEKECVNITDSKTNDKQRCISEKDLHEIFKYLPNLQNLNEEILADFKDRISNWGKTNKIADIIVRKGPFLKLYATYIKELEEHTILLQECTTRYPYFGECIREFENSELSRYIPVSKHMLTPMQRITKYKELMKQYLKYLNEDHPDYDDALHALAIVQGVAEHANEAIRELENSARLLSLQERLNGISTTEGVLAAAANGNLQHLLVEPGRCLLKEGQLMKLCRRGVRVVYLILLSDSLLYTIEELQGGRNCPLKLRYKLPLEGMRVDIPVSEDFQTEFTVISTSRSFTVRASSTKERDEWLSSLRSAIEANATRRYSFEKAKTAEFEDIASNALGKQAPAWIPDDRVTMCQVCTSEFTLTFRRHHCRACGKVVCRYCSSNRAPLEYLKNHTERVCDNCFEELQKALQELEEKEQEITDDGERERFRRSVRTIRSRFKKGVRDGRKSRSKKPERLLEVCGGDHAPQICGYLRHYSRRAWRQSWFVLKDKVLYEYRAPEDVCALSSLPILGYCVDAEFKNFDIFDGMDPSNAFQLVHENQLPLIYYAESTELAERWRSVMEKEVDL